ncbi:MAG: HAD-IC family P-type ATPase, partial [Gaiella sp.]
MGRRTNLILASVIGAALAVGGLLAIAGAERPADVVWALATAAVLVPLVVDVARSLLRGDVGVDAIALVAIVGALLLGEYLAGAIIALMLAGGNALEDYAQGRASRELRLLVDRAPRIAHRRERDAIVEVPVEELAVGDLVVVRGGEVVPADGVASELAGAVVDTSALTGEPLPVTVPRGGAVLSGVANAGDAFDLRVIRPAAESAYAGVVRLVRDAAQQRAPFVRMADRYAIVFLPVTAAIAGLAWLLSGDPVRALAVFVVATPCPLILAAPIALVAGLSRAARVGVIVKGGAAIEALGEARTVLLDKTGTVTAGEPEIDRVVAFGSLAEDELVRLAASVDQLSAHALAEGLVHGAERRGLELSPPSDTRETHGQGIVGRVDGRTVAVGAGSWLETVGVPDASAAARAVDGEVDVGRARVVVAVDGTVAGVIVMADHVRPEASGLAAELRAAGIEHVALVSGDRREVADEVG